jgi:hypothetical protein
MVPSVGHDPTTTLREKQVARTTLRSTARQWRTRRVMISRPPARQAGAPPLSYVSMADDVGIEPPRV